MIRTATLGDVPAILAIYAPYIRTSLFTFEYEVPTLGDFQNRFTTITRDFPWLVWEENGEILGYCYGDRAFTRTAYSWDADLSIYLKPEAQGRGIGAKLYEALEALLYEQGYHVLYGLVTSANQGSLQFHRAMGYREFARFEKTGYKLGHWLDIVWFEKRIRQEEPTAFPIPWPRLAQEKELIL